MNGQITTALLWEDRLDHLTRDLKRIEALLDEEPVKEQGAQRGKFRIRLNKLLIELDELRKRSQVSEVDHRLWADLSSAAQRCRGVIEAQLELLGGIAIGRGLSPDYNGLDEDFASQAGAWLNEIRVDLDLYPPLLVIVGRGSLLESETATVCAPFLDCDKWHLPLLGRALGLLAAQSESGPYRPALDLVVEPIVNQVTGLFAGDLPEQSALDLAQMLPEVAMIWRAFRYVGADGRTAFQQDHQARLTEAAEHQRAYLHSLFADMFATAICGPAYAVAVFVLELDYLSPERYELEDVNQIEDREMAARFLPASVNRAAAILATLESMNNEHNRPAFQQGPYAGIIERLKELWRAVIRSTGKQDTLDAVTRGFGNWHSSLYDNVIRKTIGIRLVETQQSWERGQAWERAMSGKAPKPQSLPTMTDILGAIWLFRLDYSGKADNALIAARLLLEGHETTPIQGERAPVHQVVARARLDELSNRWSRFQRILRSKQISDDDRAAVAGRFYRMISEQVYKLNECTNDLMQRPARFWLRLHNLYDSARPVQREALEFLGGLLVQRAGLDREPSELSGIGRPGPAISGLVDRMLLTYSRRTGVNWNARTVLGKNPFLATDTDIVRVRFPDWSLWNLPLMAHEFGHLAAPATAAFMAYQKQESEQAIEGHPDPVAAEACSYADARRHQLDEFFADVFATYTAGPAFACDVIALQLDPAEAYLWRGGHPTHDERVQVVLQTLGEMNKQTQKRIGDPGLYGVMLNQLGQGWKDAVERCGGMVTNEGVYRFQLKQALRWGRKIYCHLDMFYRLGAGYTSERWQYAMKLAKRLLLAPVPEIGQIQEMAEEYRMEEVTFDDILNALWWARLGLAKDQRTTADLTSAANLIGERFLGT